MEGLWVCDSWREILSRNLLKTALRSQHRWWVSVTQKGFTAVTLCPPFIWRRYLVWISLQGKPPIICSITNWSYYVNIQHAICQDYQLNWQWNKVWKITTQPFLIIFTLISEKRSRRWNALVKVSSYKNHKHCLLPPYGNNWINH